jgi:hypothetical protein
MVSVPTPHGRALLRLRSGPSGAALGGVTFTLPPIALATERMIRAQLCCAPPGPPSMD